MDKISTWISSSAEMTGLWKWLQLCRQVDNNAGIQKISTFRRILPQVKNPDLNTNSHKSFNFQSKSLQILGATAKNIVVLNLGEFTAFSSIVISALVGMSMKLNPNETIHITAAQSSWLCKNNFLPFSSKLEH